MLAPARSMLTPQTSLVARAPLNVAPVGVVTSEASTGSKFKAEGNR